MRTYRVSYRILPDTEPHTQIIFSYIIDAKSPHDAEDSAYDLLVNDVEHMLRIWDAEWLRRTTVARVK